MRENKPDIELFRNFLRTEAYEAFTQAWKRRFEDEGIGRVVLDSKLPRYFVACMWMSGRRRKPAKRAAAFEGVVVLGCDAAVETVRDSIRPNDCRVIQGMEIEGIMNVLATLSLPFNRSLEMQGITSLMKKESIQ